MAIFPQYTHIFANIDVYMKYISINSINKPCLYYSIPILISLSPSHHIISTVCTQLSVLNHFFFFEHVAHTQLMNQPWHSYGSLPTRSTSLISTNISRTSYSLWSIILKPSRETQVSHWLFRTARVKGNDCKRSCELLQWMHRHSCHISREQVLMMTHPTVYDV